MHVLIVEDERQMAALLKKGLEEEGHRVVAAATGPAGLAAAADGEFDVIVLDVMLPGLDGLSVARQVRAARNRTPILMLTARDTTADIVAGLDAGADDYLTKPFAFTELLARLRAVSRRGPVVQEPALRLGDLALEPSTRDVVRAGEALNLTRTEFALLEYLMRRAGHVVARNTLIAAVWGHDREIEDNTLDAFVRLLRHKVDGAGRSRLIHTVRGVGYVVREEAPE